jgi:hypothetical protein
LTLREAAIKYANDGWRVFPVGPDKTPLTQHGFHDATADADAAARFDWDRAAGVAVAVEDDIIVIDTDPRNGGDKSEVVLAEAGCDLDSALTLTSRTGGGGTHRIFRYRGDEKLKGKLAPGIDVKLPGRGYIIVPPSFGGAYKWLSDTDAIATLPKCIFERLQRGAEAVIDDGFRVGTAYGERALQGELGKMASAEEGTRNETLNKAAFAIGQLVGGGELAASAVDKLRVVADRVGLEDEEIESTLWSGYEAGLREPRAAPEKAAKPSLGGAFKIYTPEIIGPPRKLLYHPFLFERSLTWLWGPSGHGKSMVLDYVTTQLSHEKKMVLYLDWEAPEIEVERLQKMGADWEYIALRGMNEDNPLTFDDVEFKDQLDALVSELQPAMVVFNTFTAMYGEQASADGWNAPVRQAGAIARDIARHGPAVVVVDHQEDPKAIKAHGGSTKKAWSDLYLRVTQDFEGAWKPGEPYFLKIENLKPAREYVPTVRGRVMGGKGFDGPLWISWEVM